jgi:tartrate-resistant acid phosphatase type 5
MEDNKRGFGSGSYLAPVVYAILAFGLCATISAEIRFAVIGDYGADNAHTLAVANLVKNTFQPEFILTVGDNNYGAPEDIDHNIGKFYHEYIGNYKGDYGPGAPENRFFPSLGNHDYKSNGGYESYLNYFTLPGNERYYELLRGPVHFFMLNSDKHEPDGTSSTSAQADWLQDRLASSSAPWKLVVFHHAPFSSFAPSPHMDWPFRDWGADAVLAGHVHNYERILWNGFPYFVNGLGGDSINTFEALVEGSAAHYDADYGAMRVTATENLITFEFHSIADGGTLIDAFSLEKERAAPTVSLRINQDEDRVVISWPATGHDKQLQATTNLHSPQWQRVDSHIKEESGIKSVDLPANSSQMFYRLRH